MTQRLGGTGEPMSAIGHRIHQSAICAGSVDAALWPGGGVSGALLP
jgi:hypothetical protein